MDAAELYTVRNEMRIKVFVRHGRNPITEREGVVTVYTTERRENNRANVDVIKQLSKHYSVPAISVRIVSGAKSTRKTIDISLKE